MNYIAHFQQFIKLYKTPLNTKNGLPSTTQAAENQRLILFCYSFWHTVVPGAPQTPDIIRRVDR